MNGQGHAAPVRFSFFVGFFSKTGEESLDHPGTVTVNRSPNEWHPPEIGV